MASIIKIPNIPDDTDIETFIVKNLSDEEAKHQCTKLQLQCTEHTVFWYRVVPDDYVLYDHKNPNHPYYIGNCFCGKQGVVDAFGEVFCQEHTNELAKFIGNIKNNY